MHLLACEGFTALCEYVARIHKALQVIALIRTKHLGNVDDVLCGVKPLDYRGAEFVRNAAPTDHIKAFFERVDIDLHPSHTLIVFGGCLDIHSHIVKKLVRKKRLQLIGKAAVGIKLYGITCLFYGHNKVVKSVREGRLAARDDHAVKNPLALFEEGKKLLLGDLLVSALWDDQRGVMAKRATEVAAVRENNTSNTSRKIQ